MVLKIYGNIFASCTQRVITVLKELGIAYELVTVDLMSGETKTKEYLENRQPFGQVPSLVRIFFFRADELTERWPICRRTMMVSNCSRVVQLLATLQRSTVMASCCRRTRRVRRCSSRRHPSSLHNLSLPHLGFVWRRSTSRELDSFFDAQCSVHFVRRKYGGKGDEKIAEVHQKTLEKKLEGYEIILGRQKFLGGDVRTFRI